MSDRCWQVMSVNFMCSHAQRYEKAQQYNPINYSSNSFLYFFRPLRYAWMYHLELYNRYLTSDVRTQDSNLASDCKGQECNWCSIVRAVYYEDDECGDCEYEGKASSRQGWVEVGREGAAGGSGDEAAEKSGFFIVGIGMIVCEEGSSR